MINNLIRNIQNFFFFKSLEKKLMDCHSVLDVGCGYNSAIGHIKKNFTSEGVDIFKKTLELSKKRRLHDSYKLGDIKNLAKYYKDKSFDAVVAIDVIEHFTKSEALKIIQMMEKIAKKKVILLTPNGYCPQDACDGNPYQIHKSGWKKNDLEKLGFRIYGVRGLKWLRNDHASIKYKPYLLFGFLSFITEIIFYYLPQYSFDLLAIKKLRQPS